MAGGMDATLATAVLAAIGKNSATATIGTLTWTGPQHLRLMTANGSDTADGTEQTTSGGYTAGGSAMTMGAASSQSITNSASVSWTSFPSATLTGGEHWDTSGTPQRATWAPWSGGNITVGSGNTFTVASSGWTEGLT